MSEEVIPVRQVVLFMAIINAVINGLVYTACFALHFPLSIGFMITGFVFTTSLAVVDNKLLWVVTTLILFVIAFHLLF